jgi:hypothetical protein
MGPTAWKPRGRPFSPRPGTSGKAALYALAARQCKADARSLRLGWGLDSWGLDNFGKPNRELGAFADLVIVLAVGSSGLSGPFQTVEQNLHAVVEQPLPERGIGARAGEVLFRHGCEFAHVQLKMQSSLRLLGLEAG